MHDQNKVTETVIKASCKPHTIIILVIVCLPSANINIFATFIGPCIDDVYRGRSSGSGSPGLSGAIPQMNILSFSVAFPRYNQDLFPSIAALMLATKDG